MKICPFQACTCFECENLGEELRGSVDDTIEFDLVSLFILHDIIDVNCHIMLFNIRVISACRNGHIEIQHREIASDIDKFVVCWFNRQLIISTSQFLYWLKFISVREFIFKFFFFFFGISTLPSWTDLGEDQMLHLRYHHVPFFRHLSQCESTTEI